MRLRIVWVTLCGSVVQSTNTTWGGGSSSVFSRAFSAPVVSMCTSSRTYTLVRPGLPIATLLTRSRMSSTLLCEAASSSCNSYEVPAAMEVQDPQAPHGSPASSCSQLRALARMRAVDVLPVPRGPLKRYACPTRSVPTALRNAATTWPWPMISPNSAGRYRR